MKIFCTVAALLLAAIPLAAGDCRYSGERRVATPADGIRVVEVRAKSGWLAVHGAATDEVRAHGRACSSEEDRIPDMILVLERRGDRLLVEARIPEWQRWSFGSNYARLDFTVELPDSIPVIIDDGSGSIEVTNLASVEIEDGSGSIEVRRIAGAVTIRDGSGGIDIDEAGGPVRIEDGSGEISVRRVATDVIVDEDGSGAIEIAEVQGNVRVLDDGSGSIRVRNVGGDFEVRNDGSGGVSVHGVRGRVSIPD